MKKALSLLGLILLGACSATIDGTNVPADDAQADTPNASTEDRQTPVDTAPVGECTLEETRHCYSGPPLTENIGQCHGATQICYRGVDGAGHWPGLIDCATEVTPFPGGDQPRDGIDNDCDGVIDEDDQRLNGAFDEVCDPEGLRGCFWFCDAYDPAGSDTYGYRGCCTSGHFRRLSDGDGAVHGGMWIKGSEPAVYAMASDRRRHIFPTTSVMASWYGTTMSSTNIRRNPESCFNVTEITTGELATIEPGPNVTYRPGSVFTGFGDGTYYVVSQGRVLRPLSRLGIVIHVGGPTTLYSDTTALMPDFLRGDYTIGEVITESTQYNDLDEWNTTIDGELGLTP